MGSRGTTCQAWTTQPETVRAGHRLVTSSGDLRAARSERNAGVYAGLQYTSPAPGSSLVTTRSTYQRPSVARSTTSFSKTGCANVQRILFTPSPASSRHLSDSCAARPEIFHRELPRVWNAVDRKDALLAICSAFEAAYVDKRLHRSARMRYSSQPAVRENPQLPVFPGGSRARLHRRRWARPTPAPYF